MQRRKIRFAFTNRIQKVQYFILTSRAVNESFGIADPEDDNDFGVVGETADDDDNVRNPDSVVDNDDIVVDVDVDVVFVTVIVAVVLVVVEVVVVVFVVVVAGEATVVIGVVVAVAVDSKRSLRDDISATEQREHSRCPSNSATRPSKRHV